MFTVQSSVGPNPPGKCGRIFSVSLVTRPAAPSHSRRLVVTSAHVTADNGRTQIVRELHELIAALDRRLPQVERVGEIAIARAAAALKGEALKRIAALAHQADADAISSWSEPAEAPAYVRRGSSNNMFISCGAPHVSRSDSFLHDPRRWRGSRAAVRP
jgi:hypothetical protein